MANTVCPKCGSRNIKVIDEDFGRCNDCGAKLILESCSSIFCPKCKSTDVKIVDNDFGKCNSCGAKFVIDDSNTAPTTASVGGSAGACGVAEQVKTEEQSPALQTISCDKCGSNEVDIISEDLAVCRHCQSRIAINIGKKQVTNVVNNVNIVSAGGGNSVSTFAVERNIRAEDFFRSAIINNYSRENVPLDYLERDFQPVKAGFENYFSTNYDVNVSYTATVGYDRQVSYQEWNNSSKTYETKTKTITDWRPFSGTGFDNTTVTKSIGNSIFSGGDFADQRLDNSATVNVVAYDSATFEKGPMVMPDQVDIESAKSSAISNVAYDYKYKLPGDHCKDFHYSGNGTLLGLSVYSAPIYSFEYTHNDKKYTQNGFGFGKIRASGDIENEEGKVFSQINQKTKVWFILSLVSSCLSVALAVVFSLILSILIPVIVGVGISAILSITYFIIYSRTKRKVYTERQLLKREKLKAFLAKKNFAPLSAEEQSLFGKIASGDK